MTDIPSNVRVTTQARLFYEQLCNGEMSQESYYRKKTYAKKTLSIQKLVDLSVAWQLFCVLNNID